jgi:hypothetical protein
VPSLDFDAQAQRTETVSERAQCLHRSRPIAGRETAAALTIAVSLFHPILTVELMAPGNPLNSDGSDSRRRA